MNCLPDTDQVTWAIFVPLLWLNWQCSTLDNFHRIKKVNLAISQILIFYVVIPVWLRACLAHGISLFTALHIFLEILKEIKRLQNLTRSLPLVFRVPFWQHQGIFLGLFVKTVKLTKEEIIYEGVVTWSKKKLQRPLKQREVDISE